MTKRIEFSRKVKAQIIARANGKCAKCQKPTFRRGLCTTHYTRLIVHGDTSTLLTPTSANFKWLQQAISKASNDACIEWPFAKRSNGYGTIFKDGKRTTTNRLVCEMVHGAAPQQEMHAAHRCGNRGCINPKHLSWKTPKENIRDKITHGTDRRGSEISWAKLTEASAYRIKRRLEGGETARALSQEFNVNTTTISDIAKGKTWRHVA